MTNITLHNKSVTEILDIVGSLRSQGLVQHTDFDFAYNPPHYDWLGGAEEGSKTEFTFYREEYATLFTLKYAD